MYKSNRDSLIIRPSFKKKINLLDFFFNSLIFRFYNNLILFSLFFNFFKMNCCIGKKLPWCILSKYP